MQCIRDEFPEGEGVNESRIERKMKQMEGIHTSTIFFLVDSAPVKWTEDLFLAPKFPSIDDLTATSKSYRFPEEGAKHIYFKEAPPFLKYLLNSTTQTTDGIRFFIINSI